jgi:hypothetical protein
MKFLTDETICRPSGVHFCSDCLSVAFLTTISRRSTTLRPTEPECSFPAFARQRIRHLVRIGLAGATPCPWVPMVRASVSRSRIAFAPEIADDIAVNLKTAKALMLTVDESCGGRFRRWRPFPGGRDAPGVASGDAGDLQGAEPDAILEAV